MEYVVIFFAIILALVGLAGAVLPVLPGPPIAFLAMLLLLLCDGNDVTIAQLVVAGIAAAVITLLDYIAPIWFAKKTGGSKSGTWGATIGLVLALFTGMWGVLVLPFMGALLGELSTGSAGAKAVKVASYSFLAFILTTGLKMIYSFVLSVKVAYACWCILVN